jgi:hypothetical protein
MQSTDSKLSISLTHRDKINATFVKANSYILTKYSDRFKDESIVKSKLLIECWDKEFKAELDLESLIVSFRQKQDMTMFLLKWS